jgi:hypothetical protein
LKKFSDFESLLYTIPLPTGFWKKILIETHNPVFEHESQKCLMLVGMRWTAPEKDYFHFLRFAQKI